MTQNIVLICLDSVRKDIFDDMAVRTQKYADLTFDNCRAASSWSAPSHASMISGLLPHEHGVTTHSRSFNSLPRESTFFDNIDEYHTIGISSNVYAGPSYDFDRYFDSFFVLDHCTRFPQAVSPNTGSYGASLSGLTSYVLDSINNEKSTKSVLNGLSFLMNRFTNIPSWTFDEGAKPGLGIARQKLRNSSEPTFIFLNLMEGHTPYQSTCYLNNDLYDVPRGWGSDEKGVWELFQQEYDEQYWNRRNQLYRATVDYLDRQISKFIQSVGKETTIIVTADHGDNLGTEIDEGLANHKSSLSEGTLHVPLHIINTPNINEQTGKYLSQLALPDLITGLKKGYVPDITSDQISAELGGMSAGPEPEHDHEYYDRAIRCAYKNNDKIVWDSLNNYDKYQLDEGMANYQKHITELNELPAWATAKFSNSISEFKSDIIKQGKEVDINKSTEQRLEQLGYL